MFSFHEKMLSLIKTAVDCRAISREHIWWTECRFNHCTFNNHAFQTWDAMILISRVSGHHHYAGLTCHRSRKCSTNANAPLEIDEKKITMNSSCVPSWDAIMSTRKRTSSSSLIQLATCSCARRFQTEGEWSIGLIPEESSSSSSSSSSFHHWHTPLHSSKPQGFLHESTGSHLPRHPHPSSPRRTSMSPPRVSLLGLHQLTYLFKSQSN